MEFVGDRLEGVLGFQPHLVFRCGEAKAALRVGDGLDELDFLDAEIDPDA